uniref:ARAD1D01584p n=1 Tax=Blastobotrys adeninivorans TaxID=409370 RepID=A0A060T796_BLAAD
MMRHSPGFMMMVGNNQIIIADKVDGKSLIWLPLPHSMSDTFSEGWRKRQACERCRRIKVRCEYESPEQQACKRCTKAGALCRVSSVRAKDSVPKRVRKRPAIEMGVYENGSGPQDNADYPNHIRLDRRLRLVTEDSVVNGDPELRRGVVQDLRKIIDQAWSEINRLQPDESGQPLVGTESRQSSTSESQKDFSTNHTFPLSHAEPELTNGNCVLIAIEKGLLTHTEARSYFRTFATKMSEYIPMRLLPQGASYETEVQAQPVLCLSMIALASMEKNVEQGEALTGFVNRTIAEQSFMGCNCTVEYTKAALLNVYFLTPKKGSVKSSLHPMTVMALAGTFDLASSRDRDTKRIVRRRGDTSEARERVLTYLCIRLTYGVIALARNSYKMMEMFPSADEQCDALIECGDQLERVIALSTKLTIVCLRGCQKLANSKLGGFTIEDLQSTYLSHVNEMDQLSKMMGFDSTTVASSPLQRMAQMAYLHGRVSMLETIVNWIMTSHQGEIPPEVTRGYGEEIITISRTMLNSFLDIIANPDKVFSKALYFRPLFALTAMARVKLLLWAHGIRIDVDTEDAYHQVRTAWMQVKDNSTVASRMYNLLLRVGQLCRLKEKTLWGDLSRETTGKIITRVIKRRYHKAVASGYGSSDEDDVNDSNRGEFYTFRQSHVSPRDQSAPRPPPSVPMSPIVPFPSATTAAGTSSIATPASVGVGPMNTIGPITGSISSIGSATSMASSLNELTRPLFGGTMDDSSDSGLARTAIMHGQPSMHPQPTTTAPGGMAEAGMEQLLHELFWDLGPETSGI